MHQLHPSHAPTSVWKSNEIKERDELQRIVKKVKYIAPELVRSGLFPQNVPAWREFKLGRIQDQLQEKEKDAKEAATRIDDIDRIPRQGRIIRSVFGPGGKVFKNGSGPVLGMPTIWSNEYTSVEAPQAGWPTQAELLMHGDNKDMANRGYRSLPPPRAPAVYSEQSYQEQAIIEPLPMDEVEPEFTNGPRCVDYTGENKKELDENPWNHETHRFEPEWLGLSLLSCIGLDMSPHTAEVEEHKKEEEDQKPADRKSHGPTKSSQTSAEILSAMSPQFVPSVSSEKIGMEEAFGQVKIANAGNQVPPSGIRGLGGNAVQGSGNDWYSSEVLHGNYGYGHQMRNGYRGYPQQDGSWHFH